MALGIISEVDGGRTVRGTYMELAITSEGGTDVIVLETFMALGTTSGVDGGKIVREILMGLGTILEVDIGVIALETFMGREITLAVDGEKIVREIGTEQVIILVRDGERNNILYF